MNKSRGINTLAELMGNSPEVIRRHYRKAIGLAHPDADSLADRVGALEAGQ